MIAKIATVSFVDTVPQMTRRCGVGFCCFFASNGTSEYFWQLGAFAEKNRALCSTCVTQRSCMQGEGTPVCYFSRRNLEIWSTMVISFRHQKCFCLFGAQPVFLLSSDGASSGKGRVEGCAIKMHHRSIYSMGLNQDRDLKRNISWELEC